MRKFRPLRFLAILGIPMFFGMCYLLGWFANQSSNPFWHFSFTGNPIADNLCGGITLMASLACCLGMLALLALGAYSLFNWICPKQGIYHK